ncbi:MAG: hypothetical protein ABI353_16015 [Isosphaeraceae bacterium]
MPDLFAAHLPLAPGNTGSTVRLTSPGATWTPGSPGSPTFTLAGGTGASILTQQIDDATHATLTVACGTAPGLLTIGDPSTSSTATIQIKPRLRWSPPRNRSR